MFFFTIWQKLQLIDPGQALKELGLEEHNLRFSSTVMLDEEGPTTQTADRIYQLVKRWDRFHWLFLVKCKIDWLVFNAKWALPRYSWNIVESGVKHHLGQK